MVSASIRHNRRASFPKQRQRDTTNHSGTGRDTESNKSDEQQQPLHSKSTKRQDSRSSSQKSASSSTSFAPLSGGGAAPLSPFAAQRSYITQRSFKRIALDSTASDLETDPGIQRQQEARLSQLNYSSARRHHSQFRSQAFIGGFSITLCSWCIFFLFAGAGIMIGLVIGKSKDEAIQEEAMALAIETGQFFSDQLDQAILPLFSMAQFATHLGIFQALPATIGATGAPGALPMNAETWHRNVTGVCDDPELVNTYIDIASHIKKHAGMDGILTNIQLAPNGVLCLLHPMNNTEDFDEGRFLDNTPAWGLDLFQDPSMSYIALQSIQNDRVGVAGPLTLKQCPDCEPFFIARLPIVYDDYDIYVEGEAFPRWGFATALIAWTKLVEQSTMYETFARNGFEFQLTRTDRRLDDETLSIDETVVVLAQTPGFKPDNWRVVSASLDTANNEWDMTVAYDHAPVAITTGLVIGSCVLVAMFVSIMVYTVLSQKHQYANMLADSSAQDAKVNTERNMTAYFAHELRNPLSALDSALSSITTEDLPQNTKEIFDGMQLCSSFMSSIMNNLLDVRKIEEGKMRIRASPMSLCALVDNAHRMMKSSARADVEFRTQKDVPDGWDWVLGDSHRILQVLTNVVTNAIKYTLQGSITLRASWKDNFVQLECIDTGPGIPKSEQERLFERFVQRGGAPGTGLGLNIAQQIVNMMQGTICFESDPTIKSGTICRILLPMLLCKQPEEVVAKPTDLKPIEDAIKILIVDDIRMNRSMLGRRITKAIAPNAIITMAETAEEALEICEVKEFDVVICDQYMEEAGGVMVGTDAIIAMRRNKVHAFIIGCSGNDLDAEFYEAGADMVWGKPMPRNDEIICQWQDGLFARHIEKSSRRDAPVSIDNV